ncbi:MAG TPA: twin-arginine translocase TatA/TatE family subunit [Candidatus Baltobacteraceae bacterium]|jgi:Sec-independent protein translocase protein TatA|nr:twin-arginine translocase TatA/TatE family subunit [Candidatus Baltobacteraceae bacterium]
MLSLPDMAILSVLALLIFGEQKLPGIMRQAGRVMREVQNTSQSFIREMERAADIHDAPRPEAPAHEDDEGGSPPPQS